MEVNTPATPSKNVLSDINETTVRALLEENYGIIPEKIRRLDGYDDLNFYISPPIKGNEVKANVYTRTCPHGYILRINSWENSNNIEFINEYINLLLHLRDQNILAKVKCPYPIKNNKGEYKTYWRRQVDVPNSVEKADLNPDNLEPLERTHIVLLSEFIPGKLLDNVNFGRKTCVSVGGVIGRLHCAMKAFSGSKVLQRPHFIWSLNNTTDSLKYIDFVPEENKRSMIIKAMYDFENQVLPHMDELEQGIIHGDLNKMNFIVVEKEGDEPEVCGVIDFSDISHSCYLFDLAIMILYLTMDTPDYLEEFSAAILLGYPRKITDLEFNLLKTCICARIAQSLVLGLYAYHLCPSNTYLLTTQKQGWPLLENLQNQKNESFIANLRAKLLSYES